MDSSVVEKHKFYSAFCINTDTTKPYRARLMTSYAFLKTEKGLGGNSN